MNLVVIPAHNEEATVGRVVHAVRQAAPDVDVVVVNDNSRDQTAAHAEEAGATVIHTGPTGRGYGGALIRGFAFAVERGYDLLATVDADGQHDPRALPQLFLHAAHADVVSGSRYHAASPVGAGAPPPQRMRVNREFTELVNRLTGWSLTDAFCGYKAYRVPSLARLPLMETGYGFPLEFWIRAWHAGLVVVEVPVERIYLSADREFGNGLDDVEQRRAYYRRVLEQALAGTGRELESDAAVR